MRAQIVPDMLLAIAGVGRSGGNQRATPPPGPWDGGSKGLNEDHWAGLRKAAGLRGIPSRLFCCECKTWSNSCPPWARAEERWGRLRTRQEGGLMSGDDVGAERFFM